MEELKAMFRAVKAEEGTRITKVHYGYVGTLPTRQETWSWDGNKGQTVVFRSEDVVELSDVDLEKLVRSDLGVEGQITVKRTSEFAFVNHSFEI